MVLERMCSSELIPKRPVRFREKCTSVPFADIEFVSLEEIYALGLLPPIGHPQTSRRCAPLELLDALTLNLYPFSIFRFVPAQDECADGPRAASRDWYLLWQLVQLNCLYFGCECCRRASWSLDISDTQQEGKAEVIANEDGGALLDMLAKAPFNC